MGCNCNKRRKRVVRNDQALAERAERIALAAAAGTAPVQTPIPVESATDGTSQQPG